MVTEQTEVSENRAGLPAILFIHGAVGDWCVRRVLEHAKVCKEQGVVDEVIFIDIWPLDDAERWIVRRLIEQAAEKLDLEVPSNPKNALDYGLLGGGGLAMGTTLPDPTSQCAPDERAKRTPLPKQMTALEAIEAFEQEKTILACTKEVHGVRDPDWKLVNEDLRGYPEKALEEFKRLVGVARAARQSVRIDHQKMMNILAAEIDSTLAAKLFSPTASSKTFRYWQSDQQTGKLLAWGRAGRRTTITADINTKELETITSKYRVFVYAATPADKYQAIAELWKPYADRIAVEKPIDSLLVV
jgi:hypothetical protein